MSTLREAAYAVLAEAHGPLSVEEITLRAKEKGLLASTSKTPAASMGAALYLDAKKPDSLFVQTGPTQFTLKPEAAAKLPAPPAGTATDITTQVEQHNRRVKERLLAALKEMDPKAFEHLIGRLLERLGYEGVNVTKYSGDGGVDVQATLTVGGVTSVQTAVQVKRYTHNVAASVVRELRGSIGVEERGLVITTAGFTKDALTEAEVPGRVPIALVDGQRLVELLAGKQLGVTVNQVPVLDLDLDNLSPGEPADTIKAGGRYLTVMPLPGSDWLGALNAMVTEVAAESLSADAMVEWLKAQYPSIVSTAVAKGCISFIRYAGLIAYDGSQLIVTEAGAAYLEHSDKAGLVDLFCSHFVGIEETLDILRGGAHSLDEVHAQLVPAIGATWETSLQTKYRLEWLRILGAVTKDEAGIWRVVP